ncbi:MAG: glycosyltransferase [Pseudomonadota bacterium]
MRILHVVRGLLNSSGTTHIVVPVAEEQARIGHEVTVAFVEKDGRPAVEPDAALVTSWNFPQSIRWSNPGISFPFARSLNRQISNFDVLHVHAIWNFPTFVSMRAARRASVPYIVAPQGSLEPWALGQKAIGKRIYGAFTEVPLLQNATFMQALTSNEAEQMNRFGLKSPIEIIPNGINEDSFDIDAAPLTRRLDLTSDQKTLLFLSRLHPKKGVDVLIRAFASLAARRTDVTLVIAGHDAGSGYGNELANLSQQLGLGDRCRFIGEVQGSEKYQALLGADGFVLTSHSEGLPVAVVEAMAAGLPVLITPGCNIPEVEDWQAGYIVEPEPDAVVKGMAMMFDDPEHARAMGDRGRLLVREKFTWKRIARRMCDVYADMQDTNERPRAA